MYDFDHVIDRRNTHSTKWNKYAGRDVLPFWVADMDFPAPPFIVEALAARLEHPVFGYTGTPPELGGAFIDWLGERFGWHVPPDWLVWLSGVVPALNLACRAVGAPGDDVMISTPVYYPFLRAPEHGERRALTVPLTAERTGARLRYRMDMDDLAAARTERSRLFMLCNPQNPSGRVFDRAELEALAELCLRHDLVICSDEIHAALILDEHLEHVPLASIAPEIAARTITLMAPTKTCNVPGLACGVAIIPDRTLRRRFIHAQAGLVPSVGPLEYAAALAAYRDRSDWVERLTRYLKGNREALAGAVDALPGLAMTHVEATCLAWLDVSGLGLDDPYAHFVAHGLGLSDGAQFGGPGFLRFNFGCPRRTLDAGIARLEAAVRAL